MLPSGEILANAIEQYKKAGCPSNTGAETRGAGRGRPGSQIYIEHLNFD